MEILVRCHQKLREEDRASGDDSSMASTPSFLMVLAQASPYAHYFLPEDESGQNRLSFLENNVLPAGFSNKLRAAISDDAFVEYAHQHQDKSLERFLEGVADTGRRGSKQALTVLYKLADGGESPTAAFDIMDSCYRLALASEILETPSFDKEACLMKVKQLGPIVQDASEMMERHGGQDFTLSAFVSWAETHFPMLTAPLSTFVHHLLFHEHAYPGTRIEYQAPKLDKASDIFTEESSMIVTTLCLASASCNSKVRPCDVLVFVRVSHLRPHVYSSASSCDLFGAVDAFVFLSTRRSQFRDSGVRTTRIRRADRPRHQDDGRRCCYGSYDSLNMER
jgi:hypothetical protein